MVEEMITMPPRPVIDRDRTYLEVDGQRLPPGNYQITYGKEIKMNMVIVNEGDEGGWCRVLLVDELTGERLSEPYTWLNPGKSFPVAQYIKVERDLALKVYAQWSLDEETWNTTDEYG